MKSKGFTIIETMVSITIFSVLMAIVFGAWSEFQKIAFKHPSPTYDSYDNECFLREI